MKITSPEELAQTASLLKSRPRKPIRLLVSMGTCGIAAGTAAVLKAIRQEIAGRNLENAVEVSEVGCMGLCHAEPVIMLADETTGEKLIYGDVTPEQVPAILAAGTSSIAPGTRTLERNWYYPEFETAKPGEPQARIVLRNTGRLNPENIEEYLADDGYAALAKAVTQMTPQQVIDLITASGLRGRGGGGFPTGRKWQFAADQKSEEKFIN